MGDTVKCTGSGGFIHNVDVRPLHAAAAAALPVTSSMSDAWEQAIESRVTPQWWGELARTDFLLVLDSIVDSLRYVLIRIQDDPDPSLMRANAPLHACRCALTYLVQAYGQVLPLSTHGNPRPLALAVAHACSLPGGLHEYRAPGVRGPSLPLRERSVHERPTAEGHRRALPVQARLLRHRRRQMSSMPRTRR